MGTATIAANGWAAVLAVGTRIGHMTMTGMTRAGGAPADTMSMIAMATGIAKIQTARGNTCPLQLEFDPKISVEDGGIERVEQLLKVHTDNGGTLININVLDKDKLFEAHKNPELYPDLVVRVTGFTAYFMALSPEFRQLVIDRFIEGM